MDGMSRRERMAAAMAGGPVDRPPVAVWLHFASEHLSGEESADLHLRYMRRYDWDLCKVMNDYRYPLPAGVAALASVDEMRRFEPASLAEPTYAEQLACLRRLRRALGPDVPLFETLFDPVQQVLRRVGQSRAPFLYAHPEPALAMLDAVTRTLEAYVAAAREAGADGLFYSINGGIRPPAARGIDDGVFAAFMAPFDRRVLEAARGLPRILHVHGPNVDLARVLDYPCEALSWSDRFADNPSLKDARARTAKALVGGIGETDIISLSAAELTGQIDDAVAQAGRRGFVLAPGCAVPSSCPMGLLDLIRRRADAHR